MNEQDRTLYEFAAKVQRQAHRIMALPVSGRDRTQDAALIASEIMELAMQAKAQAETRETLNNPNRYDLAALPASSAFDE